MFSKTPKISSTIGFSPRSELLLTCLFSQTDSNFFGDKDYHSHYCSFSTEYSFYYIIGTQYIFIECQLKRQRMLKTYEFLQNFDLYISYEHWLPSRNCTFKIATGVKECFKSYFQRRLKKTLLIQSSVLWTLKNCLQIK